MLKNYIHIHVFRICVFRLFTLNVLFLTIPDSSYQSTLVLDETTRTVGDILCQCHNERLRAISWNRPCVCVYTNFMRTC